MVYSQYQLNLFDAIRQNEEIFKSGGHRRSYRVEAKAGSGKSFCCVKIIGILAEYHCTGAYSMFTKATTEEFRQKIINAGLDGKVKIDTAHAFGFGALRRVSGRLKVDGRKVGKLVDAWTDTLEESDPKRKTAQIITKLVGLAKDQGIGIFCGIDDRSAWQKIIDHHGISIAGEDDLEEEIEESNSPISEVITKAIEILRMSNADRVNIDFSDMIYMALLLKAPLEQFDYVIVDEAQDTNPVRQELFCRMVSRVGAMIVVGDKCQAIMGFSGALTDAMDLIAERMNMLTLPLSICYRCDKSIIKHAQQWVPDIEAHEAAGEGIVRTDNYMDFIKEPAKFNLTKHDAILCRKNAPLVATAFSLIRKGIGCRIEGRDIGWQLISLIRKWKITTLEALETKLSEYRKREVEKAQAKKQEAKVEQINDRCDTIKVLIERCQSLNQHTIAELEKLINEIFSDATDVKTNKNLLVLSTVHKAKGREWERVFILGRKQFMPSAWAKQSWEKEQELHLCYVAVTRAKHELIELEGVPTK